MSGMPAVVARSIARSIARAIVREVARIVGPALLLALVSVLVPLPARAADADQAHQVLVLLDMPAAHYRPDANYAGVYGDSAARAARRRTAQALARAHGLRLVTDWPLPALGLDCYVMDVPASADPGQIAEALSRAPRVAWAQPMNTFRSFASTDRAHEAARGTTHDDALFAMQPAAREWHLGELHAVATGRGVRVALIDSGVQRDHPDLAGRIAAAANYVADRADQPELHGTAVAGIVAARADDHLGIAGVAPQSDLLALRACWQQSASDTLCSSLTLALALHAAIEGGAQVINMSLGGPADRLVQRLVETAQARGATVVAAVDRSAPQGGFPARLPGVVAAAESPTSGTAAGAAVLAPGTDVPTTLPGSRWATVSGSSYAAAHVSGLLALLLEARGRSGAAAPGGVGLVLRADRGIDACASLARAAQRCACDCGDHGEQAAALEAPARH